MRRLILMRHAKSSWADPGQRDLDRPLNKRGRRGAALVGGWLSAEGYRPEHGAGLDGAADPGDLGRGGRARRGGGDDLPAGALPRGAGDAARGRCGAAPDVATVLMLGHQPGIGGFARRLLAAPPADADFAKYPTAATAVIEFDIQDWRHVDWESGKLRISWCRGDWSRSG